MLKSRSICYGIIILMLAGLVGCNKNKKDDAKLTNKLKIPESFKYIPADTPYMFGDIKAIPYEELGWPIFDSYAASVAQLRQTVATNVEGMPPEMVSADDRLALAVLDELDGRMTPEGIKELGLSTSSHFALYGIGVWPAVRIELSDSTKFSAALDRIEAKVGEKMPTKTFDKYTFRYIENDGMTIPLIVTETELLMGITPQKFEQEYLGLLTGTARPAKSMFEDNKLRAMQKDYGMLPYVSGYTDMRPVFDVMLGKETESLVARSLLALGEPLPELSAECQTEYTEMYQSVPRMVFGYTTLTKDRVKGVFGVEVTSELPKRLMAAKASVPGYEDDHRRTAMFSMGLGLDLGKLVDVLRDEAQRVGANPYKCENLVWINDSAEEAYFNLGNMPPFARTIQGVDFVLSDVDFEDDQLRKLQLIALVKSSNPQDLFNNLKLFFPEQLGTVTLAADSKPVALQLPPEVAMNMPTMPIPHLAMSQSALGLAMGEGMQDLMSKQVAEPGDGNTPILSLTYDIAKFMGLIMKNIPMDTMSEDERKNFENLAKMNEVVGPTTASFDIRENGFFFDFDAVLYLKDKQAEK